MRCAMIANESARDIRNGRRVCRFALSLWDAATRNAHQRLIHDRLERVPGDSGL